MRIAETGNLSEAARRMNVSLPAMSRRLSQLEGRLGVVLVRRNSRHLTLTSEGKLFYEKAGQALAEIDQAESAVMRSAGAATGALRIVTTVSFGRTRLAPVLQDYAQLHPEVTVHVDTAVNPVSIVESGHDIGICFEAPPDSALHMKRLVENPRVLCAAPDYLSRRGIPRVTRDLGRHDIIVVGPGHKTLWQDIAGEGGRPRIVLSTNDGELARNWAIDGAGLIIKSLWDVADDLEQGRLQAVLPDLRLPTTPVLALYLPVQGETAKVRSCLDFLARALR